MEKVSFQRCLDVSNRRSRFSLCTHRAPDRELSEFLSAYLLAFQRTLSESGQWGVENSGGWKTYRKFGEKPLAKKRFWTSKERGTARPTPISEASKSGFGEHTLQYVPPPPQIHAIRFAPPPISRCPTLTTLFQRVTSGLTCYPVSPNPLNLGGEDSPPKFRGWPPKSTLKQGVLDPPPPKFRG